MTEQVYRMNGTEFDDKVRAMLSEPREQIPEGLWDGIEARLAGAPARRGVTVLRRWAAGVGSVAAALAVGIVTAHFVRSEKPESSVAQPSAMAGNIPEETPECRPWTAAEAVQTAGASKNMAVAANAGHAAKNEGSEKTVDRDVQKAVETVAEEAVLVADNATECREEKAAAEGEEKIDVVKTDGHPELLAMGGEECGLHVDNSDIKSVYGDDTEIERKTPFEITVGGNSFAGPQKAHGPRRMLSRGHKAQSSKTFEESGSSATYSLPLSFGVGLKYDVTSWFGVGIGVNYTLLNKKVWGTWYDEHGWSSSADMKNSQHYIGVPVDLYFSMFRNNRWNAYAAVGGAVEKCVMNRYAGTADGDPISFTKKAKGVQTSVKAGIGIEFSPLEFLGIYIDPSVRYFFDNGQPRSIRTDQPLSFGVEAGLRFKL